MHRKTQLVAVLGLLLLAMGALAQEPPIRVGILHSTTGTMAISETTLKDVMLMLVEQQNARGGLLGRRLEAVVVDPASDWDRYAEKARELLVERKVDVIFGCWTSASRKAVLPVIEQHNGLLFYPVQYEGQESSRNVVYTGAVPNQQALPGIDYLMQEEGIERWILLGTDYVYPRVTNEIVAAYLASKGVAEEAVTVNYTPFGHSDWQEIVSRIKRISREGRRTAVISTINGDANLAFYNELSEQGVDGADVPVMALSVGEEELSGIDATTLEGHLAVWGYFQSVDDPRNNEFIAAWRDYIGDPNRVTNDPMEAHYLGFNLWLAAVTRAGTTDVDAVLDNLAGLRVPNLTGGEAEMLSNHHLTRPALVGEVRADGQFTLLWRSAEAIPGDPWSDYLPGSRDLIADWTAPRRCGAFDTRTGSCRDPAR